MGLKLNPQEKSSNTLSRRRRRRDMGDQADSLALHGVWVSPFVKRVQLALKIKGIPFEYVEESLKNKSQELLKYNPVHKKVPVLVHNGKPICESLVILEYIDEAWKDHGPSLLPEDPYKRAQVRFWADYIHRQLFEDIITATLAPEGEALEKGIKEVKEKLKVLEEEAVKCLLGDNGSPFVNGEEMGLVDIVLWSVLGAHNVPEEVLGVKIMDEEETPGLFSWLNRLIQHPIAKDLFPPKDKVVAHLKFIRSITLQSTAAA